METKSFGTNLMVICSVCQLVKKQECIVGSVDVSCPGDRRVGMRNLPLVLIEIYSS